MTLTLMARWANTLSSPMLAYHVTARKLHVDPYSSDPILTKKLTKFARVMFSARLTVDTAMMAMPAERSSRARSLLMTSFIRHRKRISFSSFRRSCIT
jgi:hypothetical protein